MKIQRLVPMLFVLSLGIGTTISAQIIEPGPSIGEIEADILVTTHDTILAASCSQMDVQIAIDAVSDGDIVLVPAGNCTWNTPALNTPAVSIYQKGITIQGSGVGQTIITDNTSDSGWNHNLIRVDLLDSQRFRLTGFSFTGVSQPQGIAIYGTSKNFRVDHSEFVNYTTDRCVTAISTSGYTYGVIDHNTFFNSRILVIGDNDAAWQRPLSLGTANAVYVEDNSFDSVVHCNTTDSVGGARYVFRYNTVNNAHVEAHTCNSGPNRGTFSYEIYENTFTGSHYTPFHIRAGTGVIFNNSITGNYGNSNIEVDNRRSCPDLFTPGTYVCGEAWGWCDGSSASDGNQPGQSGYPCLDQIGRSSDSGFGTAQDLEPLYEWNNWDSQNNTDIDVILNPSMCATTALHIQENRDYYNNIPRPGYIPYSYPHPLTKDLILQGIPADRSIGLTWELSVGVHLPPTTTWQIDYYTTTLTAPLSITNITEPTRAYTLTGLTNHEWYTVTLTTDPAMLTDTVHIMPAGQLVYLPLVTQED